MDDVSSVAGLAASQPRLPSIKAAATGQEDAAHKTARAFEAVFIGQMTQMMMETAKPEGDFSGGHGEEMFRGVLAEKLGAAVAQRGGIGLAPMVLDQIIKLQGGSAA
ncbi:rod-binding protein [Sphingomonas sp. ac-8]|uniref:rod-binding protein n=1 Tax=Sphingomonas sp. ac-8 TaxID=3242977 RepID=UPI003A7F6F10